MTETTYRFAPHPGGGFLLGLRLAQLCGFILAGLGALGALRLGGVGGLALALAILAVAAGLVLIPVRGQTLEQWAPVSVRFLLGRFSGASRFRAQRAQLGHLVALPNGSLDPQPAQPPQGRPGELAELEFLEVDPEPLRARPPRRRQRPSRAHVHRDRARQRPRVRAARTGRPRGAP